MKLSDADIIKINQDIEAEDETIGWCEFVDAYQPQLIDLLSRSEKVQFEVQYSNGGFEIIFQDIYIYLPLVLSKETPNFGLKFWMSELEINIRLKEEVQKEAEKQFNLKQEVLSKLSDEDRAILGYS